MSGRNVTHATFTVERSYDAAPAEVFAAWADPAAKARWFAGPDEWEHAEHTLDFRVGGRETSRGGPKGGPSHLYEAHYHDIVPNERIVYAYDMYLDGTKLSVSLATVTLTPSAVGTRLIFTEQGVFFDASEEAVASRERGTRDLLDALDTEMRRETTTR